METLIPATRHRGVLHTDADSILENVYPDNISENQVTNTITSDNASATYSIQITKIGRKVSFDGYFTAVSNMASGSTIFDIVLAEYLPEPFGLQPSGLNYSKVYHIIGDALKTNVFILAGESYKVEINYNTAT